MSRNMIGSIPEKGFPDVCVIFSPMLIYPSIDEQFLKASAPMVVTLFGINRFPLSLLHPMNALFLIRVSEPGSVNSPSKPEHP